MPGLMCLRTTTAKIKSLLLLTLPFCLAATAGAAYPDFNAYSGLLADYVSEGERAGMRLNLVDYPAWQRDARAGQALEELAGFDPATLASREQRLAFYINAYNLLAIHMVNRHWPVDSIKDAGSWLSPVWKKTAGEIGGEAVSLHHVEHEVLRKLGEPRIHFAIVCASLSCPDLPAAPFGPSRLDQQLEQATRDFLHHDSKGLRVENGVIRVSRIFDWFEEDFTGLGGVEAFVRRYRPDLPDDLPVKANLPYDWALNVQ